MQVGTIFRLNLERGLALAEPQGSHGLRYFWREDVNGTRFESLRVGQVVAFEPEQSRVPGFDENELRHVTNVRPLDAA
jgi:hypothetical protein